MRRLLLLLLCTSFVHLLCAQGFVTVEPPNGGASTIYTDLQAAINAAPNGSKVVMSGGTWSSLSLTINKPIHLIGAGFDFDYTTATRRTLITTAIYLGEGANGVIIEGLDVPQITMNGAPTISNIVIKYVRVSNITFNGNSSNIYIQNCIVNTIILGYAPGCKITNSIFDNVGGVNGQATFENNIFNRLEICVSNSTFKNNIITQGFSNYGYFGCPSRYGNYFYNNVFIGSDPGISSTLDFAQGNQFNIDFASLIQSYDPSYGFQFYTYYKKYDFHIKSGSAADNAGTDGTDIGIYGGVRPWKEGAVPSNPHIESKTIAPETDAQGRLKVDIRVKAQGN